MKYHDDPNVCSFFGNHGDPIAKRSNLRNSDRAPSSCANLKQVRPCPDTSICEAKNPWFPVDCFPSIYLSDAYLGLRVLCSVEWYIVYLFGGGMANTHTSSQP